MMAAMGTSGTSKRFFSGKMALIAVGVALLGLGIGAYCVMRVTNEGRISIGGFLFAGLLTVAGLALLPQAFPKGCGTCARPFTVVNTAFARAHYDHLLACFQQQNPSALEGLVGAPSPNHGDKSTLELNYCAGCRQQGEVDLIEEQWTGQYDKVLRSARGMALSSPMLAAVLSLFERRGRLSS
jgi:hypothetical protein